MNNEQFLCKVLDLITKHTTKYEDTEDMRLLYKDVYEPVFKKLQPYFRNYQDDSSMEKVLFECRDILETNHDIVNPVHIVRINKIIDENGNFKKIEYSNKKKNKKERNQNTYAKRREDSFYYFAHDFITDYARLRKTLKIPAYNLTQKFIIDQIAYQDLLSVCRGISGGFIISLLIFVVALVVIMLSDLTTKGII